MFQIKNKYFVKTEGTICHTHLSPFLADIFKSKVVVNAKKIISIIFRNSGLGT